MDTEIGSRGGETMDDWKQTIADRYNKHVERRQEVHMALKSVLRPLTEAPLNIRCQMDLVDEDNLVWNVKVGDKLTSITSDEVDSFQRGVDDEGFPSTDRVKSAEEAIQGLLLNKLTWAM